MDGDWAGVSKNLGKNGAKEMNIWQFAAENPITAIVLAYLAGCPFRYGFRAYNRYCRTKNITAQGWPPEYLDADGDQVEEKA